MGAGWIPSISGIGRTWAEVGDHLLLRQIEVVDDLLPDVVRSAWEDALKHALDAADPVVIAAFRVFWLVKADLRMHFGSPALHVHRHLRLDFRDHLVELIGQVFRSENRLEQFAITSQEFVLNLGNLDQLAHEDVGDNVGMAHALFVEHECYAARQLFAAEHVEESPVGIIPEVTPLAVAGFFVAIEADVAWVGIAVVGAEDEVIDHVVDINLRHDIFVCLLIRDQIVLFDVVVELLIIVPAALVNLTGTQAVGFEHRDIVRVFPALVQRNGLHACALAHVVVTPVLAIDVDDHRLPGLRDHAGAGLINDAGLHAVNHAGEQAVLTAVSQYKAGIRLERTILKQCIVETAFAVLAVSLDVEALLRHIQRELSHDTERHALGKLLCAVLVVVFYPAAKPVLLPVGSVFPRRVLRFAVEARTIGEHARLVVPHVVRISGQADDRHRVIHGDQIRLGDNLRRLYAFTIGPRPHDSILSDLDRLAVNGGVLRRVRTVERIANNGIERNGDAHTAFAFQRSLVQAAGNVDSGLFSKADEAAGVFCAGSGGRIVKQSRLAQRTAEGNVVVELGNNYLVQDFTRRRGKTDSFALFGQVVVCKIINAVLGRLRGVTVDGQIAVVFKRNVGQQPLAGLFDVVGQAVTLEVDGLSAHVVDLDIVVRIFDVGTDNTLIAGHDFGDVESGCIGQTKIRVHGHLSAARVGQAGGGLGEALEAGRAFLVAAPGGIRLKQIVGDQIEHTALNVGEDDGFAVAAQLEAAVRPAAVCTGTILAGGIDHVVSAGLNDRSLREAPLDQRIRIVAERIVGEVDGLV